MDVTVFDVFPDATYSFLKISRGEVYGNVIQQVYTATGVLDIDGGMITSNNQEAYQSNSLVYVKPDEIFISDITDDKGINFIGNGIRAYGKDYEVIGYGVGINQDSQEIEHYELTLQSADYSELEETS